MQSVRTPVVAGTFYPGRKEVLARDVASRLASAQSTMVAVSNVPKALIVPHAGYIYSGTTAALAYAQLLPVRALITRVVLLGPVHRVPVRGLALDGAAAFSTPLGDIEVDQEAVQSIAHMHQVVVSHAAHAQEHALEVQLPFLQSVLDHFKLVPLAVGDATPHEVGQVIEALWGGPETLFVVSSDLSHYLPYPQAQSYDRETVQSILNLTALETHEQACGATPINGLLLVARHHHLQPRLLGLCNSGDTAGDKTRVVGYAAVAFSESTHAAP